MKSKKDNTNTLQSNSLSKELNTQFSVPHSVYALADLILRQALYLKQYRVLKASHNLGVLV